jgi:hypothetical protein
MTDHKNKQLAKRKGIGFWLSLLCFILIVINPFVTLGNLSIAYNQSFQYFEQLSSLRNLFYIDLVLSTILTAYSIKAGVSLMRIEPGAVERTKKYFLKVVGYSIFILFLPFVLGLPSKVSDALFLEIASSSIKSLIFVSIWYSYLSLSKRVKETYIFDQIKINLENVELEPTNNERNEIIENE